MKPLSVFKLNIFIMFFLNIIGAYYSGLRNSCSMFRACSFILANQLSVKLPMSAAHVRHAKSNMKVVVVDHSI